MNRINAACAWKLNLQRAKNRDRMSPFTCTDWDTPRKMAERTRKAGGHRPPASIPMPSGSKAGPGIPSPVTVYFTGAVGANPLIVAVICT